MAIEVDMSGVDASTGFELIPEGTYVVKVEGAEETESSKGTPGMKLSLTILGPAYEGRKLWDTIWLSPKALPMARQRLEAMGVDIPDGPLRIDEALLYGRAFKAVVRHEPWEDRDGNQRVSERVKGYESAAAVPNDMPADPLGSKAKSSDDEIPF